MRLDRFHRRRSGRAFALASLVGLGLAGAALLERRGEASTPLTLRTIAIDGSFGDWDAVLQNKAQTTRDGDGSSAAIKANCGAYSTDRDCPLAGGAGNDFFTFAWTYDASNVYLYIQRYGSTANGVDFLFVADVNRDKKLDLTDKVVHARWSGGTGNVTLDWSRYHPASAGGDPIACATPGGCANGAGIIAAPLGYVDGYKLPGTNPESNACTGCAGQGATTGPLAGLQVELAIPWSVFGVASEQPFYWHVVSSNNASLAFAVDNIGAPDGTLGSFVQRGVSIGPDRSGALLSPGQVTYVHTIVNEGNDADVFDVGATSTQGAQIELIDGSAVIARDDTGDGTWDYIASGRDADGDGRPDVSVGAGEAHDVSVRITMPAGRSGTDLTLVTATSADDAGATATARDASYLGSVVFVPSRQDALTVAGQGLPFLETLHNSQAAADTLELQPDAGCAGYRVELAQDAGGTPGTVIAVDADGDGTWDAGMVSASADTDSDGLPDLGAIAGGASKSFWLLVKPPAGSMNGTACTVALAATSPSSGANARALHGVTVAPKVSFTPDYTRAAGTALPVATGSTAFFPVTIRNAESVARAYALSSSQATAPAGRTGQTAPRFWSDPDGDGNPSDGTVIGTTPPVGPYGGTYHAVLEVGAGTMQTGTAIITTSTAAATAGGATAQEVAEAKVGYLASYGDALRSNVQGVFAPCSTVYLEARGLLPGDATSYALQWIPPSGSVPPAVSPWATTALGTAEAQLALASGAAQGGWIARLTQGGAQKEDLTFQVQLAGAIDALATDRARYHAGDAVGVFATVRNGGAARLDGTSLGYSGTDAAAARARAGLSLAPGGTFADAYTFTLPADAPPGTHALSVGWKLACATTPFATRSASFDVAPAAPVITAPAPGSLIASNTPALSGTGIPGATVSILLTGPSVAISVGPATVDGSGGFTQVLSGGDALADGWWTATAAQSVQGIASDESAPVAFRVDATPPAAPAIVAPAADLITAQAAVTVSGTEADPDAVAVEIWSGTKVGEAAVSAGEFSVPLVLGEGAHPLEARARDAAGNLSSPSGTVTVTVDTFPPQAPVVLSPDPAVPVGAATAIGGQITISGTADAGTTVTVAVDGGAPVAAGGSVWSAVVTLADGTHVVTVTAVDEAGNTASTAVTYVVDTLPPATPQFLEPVPGEVIAGAQLQRGAVRIRVTVEEGATASLEVDGAPITGSLQGGEWVFFASLPDGGHLAIATAVDAAGNASLGPATLAFSVDATPPGAPTIDAPAAGALVTTGAVTISGHAEAGAQVSLTLDGVALPVTVEADGSFTTTATVAAGAHTIAATAIDTAGNRSQETDRSFEAVVPGEGGGGEPTGGGCGCGHGGSPSPAALAALVLVLLVAPRPSTSPRPRRGYARCERTGGRGRGRGRGR